MAVCVSAMAGDWPASAALTGMQVSREDKAPLHRRPGRISAGKTSCRSSSRPPSCRMGASLSLVRKTRARSETCTASTDGRANNFGCRPLSFPSWNQRINRTPTAGVLPRPADGACWWWSGTARPVPCYDFDGKELGKGPGAVRNERLLPDPPSWKGHLELRSGLRPGLSGPRLTRRRANSSGGTTNPAVRKPSP